MRGQWKQLVWCQEYCFLLLRVICDDFSVLGRKHSRANEKTYFGSTMAEDVYTKRDSFPWEKHHTVSQPIWKMIKLSNHIINMYWFSVFSTRKTKSGKLFLVINNFVIAMLRTHQPEICSPNTHTLFPSQGRYFYQKYQGRYFYQVN